MDTIQPIEVVWLCITLLGLSFSLYNIADAWKTYSAAELLKNGAKPAAQALAKLSIQQESVRAVQLAGFVVIGLVALTLTPDPNPPETQISTTILVVMFFTVAICLTLNTILQFLGRRKVLNLLPAVSGFDRLAEGVEQLHQDNVDMAQTLKDADITVTRKVKDGDLE
jgi:hypothetical protein